MRRILVAVLIVAVVPLVSTAAAEAVGEPVYGTVTAGGTPLADATVWLRPDDASSSGWQTVMTDSAGGYAFTVPDGPYFLQAAQLGYVGSGQVVEVNAANPQQVDFDLVAAPPLTFTGRLVDGAGAAIPGSIEARPVLLDFSAPLYSTTATASDGTFTITLPGGAGYSIFAKAPGYLDVRVAYTGSSADFGDVAMTPGATVTGVVRNSAGAPIEGARIDGFAFGPGSFGSTVTGPDGRYELQLGTPGDYQINVTMDGYLPWYVRDGAAIAYSSGVTPLDDVVLLRGGTLTGLVIDPSGTALPNVLVVADLLDTPGGRHRGLTLPGVTRSQSLRVRFASQPSARTCCGRRPSPMWRWPRARQRRRRICSLRSHRRPPSRCARCQVRWMGRFRAPGWARASHREFRR